MLPGVPRDLGLTVGQRVGFNLRMSLAADSMSFDALPPGRTRPVQWRRLFRHLRILNESDPQKVLDAAYSVGDALGGASEERLLRRFLADAAGRRIVDAGTSLAATLADRPGLGQMPDGSLGRAFLRFSERHDLKPLALIESQHEMSRDYHALDPVRQFVRDRSTVMHDLWHVLAGYDATTAGESALMCFSLPQRVNDRALPIFVAMSVLTGKLAAGNAREAIRRGARARFLSLEPFEEMLALPLEEVRERLGISAPAIGHPGFVTGGMLIPSAA
jgi:ubiquinone biosynthesis protein COQ4